jgi:fucose 4-O-acetylase-like acetyltransferase
VAQRDPWLDNVKMTLVTLVVVGHLWGQLTLGGAGQQAYDWLYAWHIPAFVLITGHLSRRFEWTRKHLLAAVTTLLVPYLIFEPAMYYFRILFGGERESGPLYLQPHWTMWYLVVLFVWRMLTPILKSHWIFVPLSVPVSLVGGSIDIWLFDLPRILGLLPFFVMGLHLEPAHLKALTSWWARVLGVAALAWLWVLAGHTDDLARTAFLYYDRPYTDLGFSEEAGLVVRLSLLGMACLGTVGGLSLIPTKGGWFTRLGAATMVVYLFHGFVVRALQYSGILGLSEERPVLLWSVMTPFGVLVALVLASPPVSRRLGVLTDPVGAWSRRRRRLEAPTSA